MPLAFRLLTVLLAAIPALAIAQEGFARHVAEFAAAILLIASAMAPQPEIATVSQLLRRFSPAIAFPLLWMLLQIVPLPVSSPANPIWSTTSAALGGAPLPGHVSIDPGATLRSLMHYLALLALAISAALVARDRHRAETIFLVLATVTTFMSTEVLLAQFEVFAGMIPTSGNPAAMPYVAMAALATLANSAIVVLAAERRMSRSEMENPTSTALTLRFVLALCGLAIAVAAMRTLAPLTVQALTALGFLAIIFVAVVRRLGLPSWPSVALFVIIAGTVAAIVTPQLLTGATTELAGYAATASTEWLAQAGRAMVDTPWLGNGVGTFDSLAPVYQDFGAAPAIGPPTTAISIAIEWGKPALAIMALFAFQVFVFTFRGAIRRGRDSSFAAAAAATVLVISGEAFCDPSLLTVTVEIVVATMIGLGISQTIGRTRSSR